MRFLLSVFSFFIFLWALRFLDSFKVCTIHCVSSLIVNSIPEKVMINCKKPDYVQKLVSTSFVYSGVSECMDV